MDSGMDAGPAQPRSEVAGDAGRTEPEARPMPPPVIAEPDDRATYIYDQDELRTYELLLDPQKLAQIDADPRAEEYVQGMLRFEGRDYGPLGIRYKGSVGAFRGCVTTADPGVKSCTKLSMKVKFNHIDPEGRFYGLKKLQFHAMNRDPSMLKERLGYAMFRESGVAAPRAVHARLLINGEFVGLFALIEQVDGRFTRSRFDEGGKGNLYKEAWPVDAAGATTQTQVLLEALRTNEDEDPSVRGMHDFGRAIEGAGDGEWAQVLTQHTDLDYTMRYVAVDRVIAHDDGPMRWYCFGASCFNHNFYWYEEAEARRLWIVAWDLDGSFNLDNTTTTIWFDWEDTSLGCRSLTMPPFNVPIRPPTCDPLLRSWAGLQRRYLDETQAFLEGPFDAKRVDAKLATWEEQIAPMVEEAAAAHDDAVSPQAWRTATADLRETIEILRERAEARLALGELEIGDPWAAQDEDTGRPDGGHLDREPGAGPEDPRTQRSRMVG
ncbi:MAG: CotH kinase family protein [Myxococcales bacterium]|nr:CotH kinase family protein [Myxococcales bacterium]